MESKQSPLPLFDLDDQGHVRLHWTREAGSLHGLLTLDEALDLQFELATFLAQIESGIRSDAAATLCECEPAAAAASDLPGRLLN